MGLVKKTAAQDDSGPSRAHNVALAAVWSTILRQPLIFPRKNPQSGIWWGPYQRSLREEGAAPLGANIVENVTFSATNPRPHRGSPGKDDHPNHPQHLSKNQSIYLYLCLSMPIYLSLYYVSICASLSLPMRIYLSINPCL